MLNAELYLLAGETATSTGAASGFGCYVGMSDVLRTRTERVEESPTLGPHGLVSSGLRCWSGWSGQTAPPVFSCV